MKACRICEKQFKPRATTSVTCGAVCKKKNDIENRDKGNKVYDTQTPQVRFKNIFLLGGIYAA